MIKLSGKIHKIFETESFGNQEKKFEKTSWSPSFPTFGLAGSCRALLPRFRVARAA
jgi:hypothetical protein